MESILNHISGPGLAGPAGPAKTALAFFQQRRTQIKELRLEKVSKKITLG